MADPRIIARVHASVLEVDANAWNALLAQEQHATPFMRHEYLAALERSDSATPRTGWAARFISLWDGQSLIGACPLYLKSHSYGEYVFDWAWASAYEQHGVPYYPKAVIAVPFTPVPGARLLARDAAARTLLVEAARQYCLDEDISSLHILFASEQDQQASAQAELMPRHTVQFHWQNQRNAKAEPQAANTAASKYSSFDDFLGQLTQEKRKKIRQERRRVAEAGVTFRWSRGRDISTADWDFFYRCYERTYLEHGNPPYLTRAFFTEMEQHLPEAWVLFVAERNGRPIASSLIAVRALSTGGGTQKHSKDAPTPQAEEAIAYGRYWGALERVDCLHFEACYYQPIAWCIEHGISRFEGGAQGEHKMARALLPVQATSAHWLAHPAFADAVERFLDREGEGVEQYLQSLQQRSPLRSSKAPIQPDPEA
ncbi:GNAT family N-acetyltransferase [Acidovorax sp. DW039]|uniref:GNAT family N-acetyltransferase n=1 Tax=Acidovorax sp. DW039 TaxID=3095606 RepID=UPI00308ECA28|nr:GNAT family N-acetyltransferase [Acidovorax sp. DW039]